MKKAEMQEMYNEMLRSGNWDYRVCECLCEEAGMMRDWEECNPAEVEGVINRAVERLGLTETVYKTRSIHANLSDSEVFKLSVMYDNLDLDDVAERLLVKLANGTLPTAYLSSDDPFSFEGWLEGNGKLNQAKELVKRSDEEAEKELNYLYDVYSDSVEGMIEMYDNAIANLKESIE